MGQAIVISLGLPKYRLAEAEDWPRCWALTPTRQQFSLVDDEAFRREYEARLNRIGLAKISRDLEGIAKVRKAHRLVLCCFEPLAAKCHRSVVASWFAAHGEVVSEVN